MSLQKKLLKIKGLSLSSNVNEHAHSIEQTTIARAWGVSRLAFPQFLAKMQSTGELKRKLGSGAQISVMPESV